MSIIEHIVRLVAPHECLGCTTEDHLLCPACVTALPSAFPVVLPGIDRVWAATRYEGVTKAVLYRLKFGRAQAAAQDIANCLADRLPEESNWLVTHVPTVPARVRQRGYDQAKLIARAFAARRGLAYVPLLTRLGNQRQLGADRVQRHQQMVSAFRPLKNCLIYNSPVLLIDDVLTTGATLEAAAQTLRAAGVVRIDAAVFAHA